MESSLCSQTDNLLILSLYEKKEYINHLVNRTFYSFNVKGDDVSSRMKYFGTLYHKDVKLSKCNNEGINDVVQSLLKQEYQLLDGNKLNKEILFKNPEKMYKNDFEYLSFYAETLIVNKLMEDLFNPIPKKDRFIFLPHCIRPRRECLAEDYKEEEKDVSYEVCVECGSCSIGNDFIKIAENLGYDKKNIAIVGGGEKVPQIISEYKPKAVVGVACPEDLRKFMAFYVLGSRDGVNLPPGKMILLSSLGCKNTSFDNDDVKKVLYN